MRRIAPFWTPVFHLNFFAIAHSWASQHCVSWISSDIHSSRVGEAPLTRMSRTQPGFAHPPLQSTVSRSTCLQRSELATHRPDLRDPLTGAVFWGNNTEQTRVRAGQVRLHRPRESSISRVFDFGSGGSRELWGRLCSDQ